MEKILQIATSFYKMTHIQANPQKSFLFTLGESNTPDVKFDNTTIQESIIPIRYLGIWIEKKTGKKFQKNLIFSTTTLLLDRLTWKRIIDKQITYLTNHVIFPKLEYLLNDMVLSKEE